MGLTRFPNGLSSFGVPVMGGGQIPQTTGTYFFVDDGGSNANDGLDPDHPVADINYAIGLCTNNVGDVIIVMPGHAESTTAIAVDIAGITIVGLGWGASRPTLTATAVATGLFVVTAASVHMDNLIMIGPSATCTALVDLAATADDFWLSYCDLRPAETPEECIQIATGACNGTIEYCKFRASAEGVDQFILFQDQATGSTLLDCSGWTIRKCFFDAHASKGCDDGMICVSISSGGLTGALIEDCDFVGSVSGEQAIDAQMTNSGRADSCMVKKCNVLCAVGMDAFVQSDLMGYIDCHVVTDGTHSHGGIESVNRTPFLSVLM